MARIKRAIRRNTSGGVQELAVEMQGDSLLLRGRCLSFYCKQVAQETAMSEFSGRPLINQIEVGGFAAINRSRLSGLLRAAVFLVVEFGCPDRAAARHALVPRAGLVSESR